MKFKDERVQFEQEKKRTIKETAEIHEKLDQYQKRYVQLRQDVEESPISTLRKEIGEQSLKFNDLQSKLEASYEARDDYK
jgi:ABC-type Zn uptake system ZnuABC Zn-binding protein ZnuA